MAKDKISDYSTTANSNTDIGGINVDEGCAPSGINDAIRTLMAQLKTWQSGGQDVYIHPAGSASAPSITANGDTNTGLFFPAADTVGIATGGTERARVDSSGNLGLGVTPATWSTPAFNFGSNAVGSLSVIGVTTTLGNNINFNGGYKYTTTAAVGVYQISNNSHIWYNAPSGTAGNAITFTQAMTLDASGNLGLGTTSPAISGYLLANIKGGASTAPALSLDATSASGGRQFLILTAGSPNNALIVYDQTAAAERARIDTSGNLLVGTTSTPGAGSSTTGVGLLAGGAVTIQRAAATPFYCGRSNDGEVMALYSGTTQRGQVSISGATTTYGSFSDYRLKENIVPLTGAVAKVMALKPSTFNFIEFPEQTINGFIAHEVAEVEPIAVTGQKDAVDEEGNQLYQSVDPAKLVPLLTAALQEQQAIITALTARITALEQA
jgi:hypothetical protein